MVQPILRRIDPCPARLQEESDALDVSPVNLLVDCTSAGRTNRNGVSAGSSGLVVGDAGSCDHCPEHDRSK